MKESEFNNYVNHLNSHLDFLVDTVLNDYSKEKPRVDVLIYSPTRKYPFWKLFTAGASDISMSKQKLPLASRNEYVMFVSPKVRFFVNNDESKWYIDCLRQAVKTIKAQKINVKPCEVFKIDNADGNMVAATFFSPLKLKCDEIEKCRLAKFKDCNIFQLMPLNEDEADKASQGGEKWIMEAFYPEFEDEPCCFAKKER